MLQELAAQTGASAWVIASMLFFLAVWVAVVVWVVRRRPEEMEARACLPLEGDGEEFANKESGVRNQESGVGRRESGTFASPESRILNPGSCKRR